MSAETNDTARPEGTGDASGDTTGEGWEGPATVLYVDDDRANLVAFRAMVSDVYNVLTARSGEEALQVMSERRDIAVLITDQRMPGISGADLCERVRKSHPDTVRMLVTAYSDLAAAIDAINRGHVSRYLRKPWDPDELLAALREAAELHRLTITVQRLQVRINEAERMYTLGVLVAGIGHELRNPLGWVTTNLGFSRRAISNLEARLGSRDPQVTQALRDIDEALRDASEGATRLQEIVDGISLSSRNEAPAAEPVDLSHVARSVVRLVQGEAHHRGRLQLELGAAPLVRGSATRIGQVLLNLLVNAIQALPARRLEDNVVVLAVALAGDQALVTVRDNGVGIEPVQLSRVFAPFFTTKRRGTGLGLAICKQIVEEMGGKIAVESRLGEGTTFTVRLPLSGR